MRFTTPRSSRQGDPRAIDDLDPGYRARGRAPRAAGYRAAISCVGPYRRNPALVHMSAVRGEPENSRAAALIEDQSRTYWWCSPPRIGRQRIYPARPTVRENGASFSKEREMCASAIIQRG